MIEPAEFWAAGVPKHDKCWVCGALVDIPEPQDCGGTLFSKIPCPRCGMDILYAWKASEEKTQ